MPVSMDASRTKSQSDAKNAREVEDLKTKDAKVRAHEQAHVAAAGPYAKGSPHYEYVTGPDGKRYAVGGEVEIDTSPIPNDPDATVRKAETVKRAALAPADPSAQDRRVAAEADQMERQAQTEKSQEQVQQAVAQTYDGNGLKASSKPQPFAFDFSV